MKRVLPFIFLLFVAGLFFYQSVFFGRIPFPGDMLIAQYVPWKYESILGFNPGSYPNKAQYFDVIQQLYPWRQLVVEQVLSGRVPLWNPYNFSGTPLLANIQSSVFNPVNIFFFVLPMTSAWTITIFLQCLIASIFMYLFARKITLPILPALLSATSYSYSLFMTVFLEYNTIGYVVAVLPATLYFLELHRQRKTFLRAVGFVLSVSLLFLVGHIQLAAVSFFFLTCYLIVARRADLTARKNIFHDFFLLVLSLVIASIQLLPSVELLAVSARVPQDYRYLIEKLLIQPWQLIMFVMPDIFGNPVTRNFIPNETYPTKALSVGVIALLFSVIGIWRGRKEKRINFFIGSFIVILILVTRNPLSSLMYDLNIPLFSTSSPSNMIFLGSFCLSIMAGFGMKIWMESKISRKWIIIFLSLVIFLFIIALSQRNYFQEKNILFSLAFIFTGSILFLLGTYRREWSKYIAGVILLFVIAESFFFFQKFNPFVPKELVYPKIKIVSVLRSLTANGERVWSFGNAAVEPNVETALQLYSPEGYDPLYPAQYGELLYASKEGRLPMSFDNSTRSNAMIAPQSSGAIPLSQNDSRLKVLNILSVRFILDRSENASSEKTFPPEIFKRIYQADGWSIYENMEALPTAWLTSSAVVEKSSRGFENTFFNPSFQESKAVIASEVLEKKLTMKKGNVTQFLNLSDRMLYKTVSDGTSLLVLSKTYYPGWEVYIDGQKEQVLRVNHALSGVVVPEGEHDVVLYYWPRSFVFGMYLTIIGIVVLIVYVGVIQKKYFPK